MLNAIIWDASPIAFHIGEKAFLWYSLLFAGGLWAAYFNLKYIFSLENIGSEKASFLWVLGVVTAIVGARLFEVVFYNPNYFKANPGDIIKFWDGGLSSHGTTFALIVLVWAYAKWGMNKSFLWLGDRFVVGIALGAACVRIGNLFNSEIVGTPTSMPWGFIFKAKDEIPRHPIQLYEAIAYIILFFVLFRMIKKGVHLRTEGVVASVFLIGMFGTRFLLEFTKANISTLIHDGAFLSMGQWLSLPVIILGVVVLWTKRASL